MSSSTPHSRPKVLNFITSSADKVKETRALLEVEKLDIALLNQRLDIPELQGSIEEIALGKCARAAELVGGAVLTEDTALEMTALKGLPGPYIKWFIKAIGHDGLNKLLEPYEDKSITAICTFAYSPGPGHEPILFQGKTQGKLVPARGPLEFGGSWESIFSLNK